MAPIRGQKRKSKEEEDVDLYAPLFSLKSQPRPSDWWDDFSKRFTGQSKDLVKFESAFKLSRSTFNYICSLVKEETTPKSANLTDLRGKILSLDDQVAIALRRLSSGESLSAVGDLLGIHQSTVHKITWRFVEVMETRGIHHLRWPSNEEDMNEIKSKFEKLYGLPNCCGAIDTANIRFCSSEDSSSKIWFDNKKNASMILQAIVDPEMRFLDVVAGWPGSMSDNNVLRNSKFFKLVEEGKRLNVKRLKLSEEVEIREYIVGNTGLPPLPWLLTPYQGKKLSKHKTYFNNRHQMAQKLAQRAFAKLKERWKIIQGVMWRPDKHKLPRIILVCCILHNILIDLKDDVQDEEMPLSHYHDPKNQQQSSNSANMVASIPKEKLAHYLSRRLPNV